jgi:hypothetical protein
MLSLCRAKCAHIGALDDLVLLAALVGDDDDSQKDDAAAAPELVDENIDRPSTLMRLDGLIAMPLERHLSP